MGMKNPFRCRHPWAYLAVLKPETFVEKDQEFFIMEIHLHCHKCGKDLHRKYSTLNTPHPS